MEGTAADPPAHVRLTLLAAGRARFRMPLAPSSARRGGTFPITVALIEHPQHGSTLVDTGVGDAYFEALRVFPARVFSGFVEASLEPAGSVAAQLQRLGVCPDRVILTHLHPDHVGGLRDLIGAFPRMTVLLSGAALRAAERVSGPSLWTRLFALRLGFLPDLLPLDDLKNRQALCVSDGLSWSALGPEWAPFGLAADLFGDGSVRLVRLPGHAVGQLGALLRTAQGYTLLGADAAWSFRAVREQRGTLGVARMIVADRAGEATLLRGLADLAQRRPDVRMLFSHGRESRGLVSAPPGDAQATE